MDVNKPFKKEVNLYFLKPGKGQKTCEDMKMAFEECKEADLTPKWLTAAKLDTVPCTKNTVFILPEFCGPVFDKLQSTKSVICGPMCIRTCLIDSLPIPENKSPVFTTAMREVIVSASQVTPEVKSMIKKKVGFMGGVYMNNLVESVTHLVTNSVRSVKYERAVEIGIPVMKLEWVEDAWEQSQNQNIKATEPSFLSKYKCPIFFNMNVTSSNMPRKEKEQIKDLVNENGGAYKAQMRQSEISLVVAGEAHGNKCFHARLWGVPVVKPSYILDSVRSGYALPFKDYVLEPSAMSSTPTKDTDAPNFTCNTESISMINFESSKINIDDTQTTFFSLPGSQTRRKISGSQHAQILEKINVSDAKKSGSFLDGCKVFLSGFTDAEAEKLRRILSLGGATVFSELSDSVSHVLIGEFIVNHMKAFNDLIQKPHVVTLEWLEASLKLQAPAGEEPFYCLNSMQVAPEPPSPLSQKGVQLLQPDQRNLSETSKMPPPAEPTVNRKLFSEFLKENANSPAKETARTATANQTLNSTAASEEVSINPEIFVGHKFAIAGFTSEVTAEIETAVNAAGGSVVPRNFSGVADYAVVPLQTIGTNVTAVEVVTNLWLEDCLDAGQVLPIHYYHQPFSVVQQKKPLAGCCVSLSNYFGKEKAYLIELLEVLGATYQDVFARVAKQDKGVQASSHLVCPRPEGQKYKAGVKWGLPIVYNEWLLACARQGLKLPVDNYLVKDITEPPEQKTKTESLSEILVTPAPAVKPLLTPEHMTPSTPFIPPERPASRPPSEPVTPATTCFVPPNRTVSSLKRKSSLPSVEELSPFHVSTPDTPYGQVFETPTRESKKRWKKFVDNFPCKGRSPPTKPKRQSTPLSELKRRVWAAAMKSDDSTEEQNYSIEEMDEEPVVNEMYQTNEIESMKLERILNQVPTKNSNTPGSQSTSFKDCENVQPRRFSAGRSTPSASDFKTTVTPSSHEKIQNKEVGRSSSNDSISLNKSPPKSRKSSSNEIASAMLGKLLKSMSTPKRLSDEPQPLPQRELISPVEPKTSSYTKPVSSTLLPESQPVLIGWEDPVESAERAKAQNPSTSGCLPKDETRKFVLSNVAEKEKYEEHLRSVGETVASTTAYEPDTTHLIMDKPVRSEKLLCCLAAGKWVLRTSYIDYIVKHNQYLPVEEKFEWGGVSGTTEQQLLNSLEQQLADAAIRWRKAKGGAFSEMKAVLVASGNKFESYQRLIMAGGGRILPLTLASVGQATHCFVESSKVNSMSVPLSEFVAHRVPCLPPIFLGDMLIKHPPPSVSDAVIAEYRNLLRA